MNAVEHIELERKLNFTERTTDEFNQEALTLKHDPQRPENDPALSLIIEGLEQQYEAMIVKDEVRERTSLDRLREWIGNGWDKLPSL